MNQLPPLLGLLALPAFAFAQVDNQFGFDYRMPGAQAERFGANTFAADCLHHFDSRHYRDWMLDPADPTGATYTFRGLRCVLQDQVPSTPETYALVGYREDPASPDFPDTSSPWFRTGPLNLPPMPGPGPAAWILTITVPPTMPSVPKGDVWLGVGLSTPLGAPWPLDGLSLHTASDAYAGPTIASLPNGQVACYVPVVGGVPTGPAVYVSTTALGRRQLRFEILANATGSACISRRGFVESTSFLSGLHPDVYNGSGATPPRYDDIGFVVWEENLPDAPLFVAVAFGGNPAGSPPIATLSPLLAAPGTRGNLCIDLNQSAVFFTMTGWNGFTDFRLPLSMQVRTTIQALSSPTSPFDLWYQGFVLNTAASGAQLEVRATGCGVQHL